MIRRLKIKFVCIFMVIVTIMLGIIFGTVLSITYRNMEQHSISAMKDAVAPPAPYNVPKDGIEQAPIPHFSLVITPEGEFVADDNGLFDLSDKDYLNSLFEYAESCEEESGIIPDTSLRYFRNVTPTGNSYVFTDVSAERDMLEGLFKTSIIIGVVAFVLFFIISIFLAKWAVKPVEIAWNKQKQFIADASHELKTPLTVITTNAELIKSEEQQENKDIFTDNILVMSKQMRGLVERMLEIARIDNGSLKNEFKGFNLSEAVSDAILPFEALFFEKGQTFDSEIETNIKINGNAEQVKQVVDIFLDNANKYANEQSDVKLTLKKHGRNHCRLSVSNRGEAISDEDLENIFKRFYRGDETRKMNNSYGLGLSIAEGIVKEHSGKIFAESNNGVNTFTVQFNTI